MLIETNFFTSTPHNHLYQLPVWRTWVVCYRLYTLTNLLYRRQNKNWICDTCVSVWYFQCHRLWVERQHQQVSVVPKWHLNISLCGLTMLCILSTALLQSFTSFHQLGKQHEPSSFDDWFNFLHICVPPDSLICYLVLPRDPKDFSLPFVMCCFYPLHVDCCDWPCLSN